MTRGLGVASLCVAMGFSGTPDLAAAESAAESTNTITGPANPEAFSLEEIEALLRDFEDNNHSTTVASFNGAQGVAAAGLGSAFGKLLFSSLFDRGVNMGIDQLLELVGLSGTQQLNQSLREIDAKLDALHDALKAVYDAQQWNAFVDIHSDVSIEMSRIRGAYTLINNYVDAGTPKDSIQTLLDGFHSTIVEATNILSGGDAHSTGLLDSSTGAVSQLIAALPMDAYSTAAYYEVVDSYRDSYRNAFVTAYSALELLRDHYGIGTKVETQHVLDVGRPTIETMYAYGVRPQVFIPENLDQADMIASRSFAVANQNRTYAPAGVGLEVLATRGPSTDVFTKVSRGTFGGFTYEQHLQNLGLPTQYVLDDTWSTFVGGVKCSLLVVRGGAVLIETKHIGSSNYWPQKAQEYIQDKRVEARTSGYVEIGNEQYAAAHPRNPGLVRGIDQHFTSWVGELAENYKPVSNQPATAEEWLKSEGFPTRFFQRTSGSGSFHWGNEYQVMGNLVTLTQISVPVSTTDYQMGRYTSRVNGEDVATLVNMATPDSSWVNRGGYLADMTEGAVAFEAFGEHIIDGERIVSVPDQEEQEG